MLEAKKWTETVLNNHDYVDNLLQRQYWRYNITSAFVPEGGLHGRNPPSDSSIPRTTIKVLVIHDVPIVVRDPRDEKNDAKMLAEEYQRFVNNNNNNSTTSDSSTSDCDSSTSDSSTSININTLSPSEIQRFFESKKSLPPMKFKGFLIELLDEITSKLNVDYEIVNQRGVYYSYANVLEMTGNGVVDRMWCGHWLVQKRLGHGPMDDDHAARGTYGVRFTSPYITGGLGIIARSRIITHPTLFEKMTELKTPFSNEVWLCFVLILIVTSLLMLVIDHKGSEKNGGQDDADNPNTTPSKDYNDKNCTYSNNNYNYSNNSNNTGGSSLLAAKLYGDILAGPGQNYDKFKLTYSPMRSRDIRTLYNIKFNNSADLQLIHNHHNGILKVNSNGDPNSRSKHVNGDPNCRSKNKLHFKSVSDVCVLNEDSNNSSLPPGLFHINNTSLKEEGKALSINRRSLTSRTSADGNLAPSPSCEIVRDVETRVATFVTTEGSHQASNNDFAADDNFATNHDSIRLTVFADENNLPIDCILKIPCRKELLLTTRPVSSLA